MQDALECYLVPPGVPALREAVAQQDRWPGTHLHVVSGHTRLTHTHTHNKRKEIMSRGDITSCRTFINIFYLDGDVAVGDFVRPAVRWRSVGGSGSLKDTQNTHSHIKMTYANYCVCLSYSLGANRNRYFFF